MVAGKVTPCTRHYEISRVAVNVQAHCTGMETNFGVLVVCNERKEVINLFLSFNSWIGLGGRYFIEGRQD